MELATLYKITSTGAVQTWQQELSGNKYRTHSGQLEGAITTSEWTICVGKNIGRANETSPEEQARLEVEANYTLKRKKGYRDSVDGAQTSDRFQCMLAEHYSQKPKETDASYQRRMGKIFTADGGVRDAVLWVQPKLDGIRCIANAKGLWSRENNKILAVPHIFEVLRPLFEAQPEIVLDGELYNHDLRYDFNKIVSMVKKQKPTVEDLELSRQMVQYWVYDVLVPNRDAPFSTRFVLNKGIEVLADPPLVKVPTFLAVYRTDVDAIYESFLEEGYEGGMVRLDVPYENKRTFSLLKRKEKMDAEFKIIRFEEGVGNAAGMAKIAHMEIYINGKLDSFKADICGTREECREYLKLGSKLVGKFATIEFQNYTPDGKPRFPKLKVAHLTGRW